MMKVSTTLSHMANGSSLKVFQGKAFKALSDVDKAL